MKIRRPLTHLPDQDFFPIRGREEKEREIRKVKVDTWNGNEKGMETIGVHGKDYR